MSQTIPIVARRKKASSPIPSRHPTCVAPPALSVVLEVAVENILAECYSRLADRDMLAIRRQQGFALVDSKRARAKKSQATKALH